MRLIVFLFFTSLTFSQSVDFEKGVTLFNKQQWENAKVYFEKALQQDPLNEKTQEYLGDIAGCQKKWDKAAAYYKKLISTDESNATYHFKYGGVLALQARESNKLKAFSLVSTFKKHLHKAVILDTNHIEARWALVEVYVSLPTLVGGSETKAKIYAKELLQLSPVDGYLAYGYIAEYNDKPEEAEKQYKKAIEVGGSQHTYNKLSGLYEGTSQPDKAIDTYEKSHKKHLRNQVNYQIGKVCAQYNLKLDKGLESLKLYLKNYSVKDGVEKPWAYYRIAQIYRHKDDKRNAYNWIQKTLAEKPNLKAAKKEKALILKMKNKG